MSVGGMTLKVMESHGFHDGVSGCDLVSVKIKVKTTYTVPPTK